MQDDYLDKVFLLLYVGAEIFHDDLNKKKRSHLCTQMDVLKILFLCPDIGIGRDNQRVVNISA